MPTLYVENVPDNRYEALRKQAREHRRSIAAEVISILEATVPTEQEIQKRWEFLEYAKQMRARRPPDGNFPSTEEMIREDRGR